MTYKNYEILSADTLVAVWENNELKVVKPCFYLTVTIIHSKCC